VVAFLDGRVRVRWEPVAVAEPLLRSLVAELTGRDPGPLHHTCPFCGSVEHGRPYVEDAVDVSVAHAPGLTLVAASIAGPVGVDLEPHADDAWVRFEAIGKARGTGLVDLGGPAATVLLEESLDIPDHAAVVVVLSAPAKEGAPASTARPRTAPREARRRSRPPGR